MSEDWKLYFKDTAVLVNALVEKGDVSGANFEKYREALSIPDEYSDWEIYIDNFLTPKTRKALSQFNSTQKAA